jgi:glycosyltransferase involved in cell wall biosynthesis
MRVGVCPTRGQPSDYRPARVTVCVLVFIPNRLGYYAHRFDVLKLCLRSILTHTTEGSYDLLVLDNGSCAEVVDYLGGLHDQKQIQYLLLLDRNIGKLNAFRIMFEAAPGELIAYTDDDIFFCPGWLEAQLELFETFPRVGMVSGRPVRKQFKSGNKYLPAYLSDFPEVSAKFGHFIPEAWEVEYLQSTGRSLSELADVAKKRTDILLEYRGVKAYSTATHFQFIAPRQVILEGLSNGAETPGPLIGGEKKVEQAIDAMGYARLSTFGRYVRHMGNVVTTRFLEEAADMLPASGDIGATKSPSPLLVKLTQHRVPRALMSRLNRWSYMLLHQPKP